MLLTKEEYETSIMILSNAEKLTGLSRKDLRLSQKVAAKLRKGYSAHFARGERRIVKTKRHNMVDRNYMTKLLKGNPDATMAELTRKAREDGHSYRYSTIRNHVMNVMGLNTHDKRREFSNS